MIKCFWISYLEKNLKQLGYNIITLDRNEKADINTKIEDYNPTKKWKIIIALEVLEHGFFNAKISEILEENGTLIASFPNPKLDGIMRFLSWNGLWNSQDKQHYLEHVNLFEPEEFPLKLVDKQSLCQVCYMCTYTKVRK